MALMTTQQAAARIGVSARHVQRLVAGGDLVAVGPDRIDAGSVAQWKALRGDGRARGWEEATAWAAVALLEGQPAPWLGQAQRSRLRSALRASSADELAVRARNRAEVLRFHAHPRALGRLGAEIVSSGATDRLAGLSAAADRLDGYLDRAAVPRLVQRYRLEPDPAGSVVLRATSLPMDDVMSLANGRRQVLAGLDLAGSTGTRERSTGARLLDRALAQLRG